MPSATLSGYRRIFNPVASIVLVCLVALGGFLLAHAAPSAQALSAQIAARVDATIITERDIDQRQNLYLTLMGLPRSNRMRALSRDFFTEMAVDSVLKRAFAAKNKVVASEQAVSRRARALSVYGKEKALRGQIRAESVLFVEWEILLLSLVQASSPLQQLGLAQERARRQSAAELASSKESRKKRYVVEEIFLEASGRDARVSAEALAVEIVGSLAKGNSFSRVAAVLPGSYEFLSLPFGYENEFPPMLRLALRQRAPRLVESVRGFHLYRLRAYQSDLTATRYSFVQAAFARTTDLPERARFYRNRFDICFEPARVAQELGAYDIRLVEDVLEEDLNPDTRRVLGSLQLGESGGPFPASESIAVFLTLCSKKKTDETRDSSQSILRVLQARRADEISAQLLSRLRLQADVSFRAAENR